MKIIIEHILVFVLVFVISATSVWAAMTLHYCWSMLHEIKAELRKLREEE